MLLLGNNANCVYALIKEFLTVKDSLQPELDLHLTGISGLTDAFILAEISEKFIIKTGAEEKEIKKALAESYRSPGGVSNFVDYRQALEKEKDTGFKNLAHILEKRKKLYADQKSLAE